MAHGGWRLAASQQDFCISISISISLSLSLGLVLVLWVVGNSLAWNRRHP